MRRRSTSLVTLGVAVLLTGLAVVAGLGLAPREVRVPIAVGAPTEVSGARVSGRTDQEASRSADREPEASRSRVEGASLLIPPRPPAYRLHRAGAPLERAPRAPAAGR
ncbi:hypothetical protein, partial [Nocardioides marmotae]